MAHSSSIYYCTKKHTHTHTIFPAYSRVDDPLSAVDTHVSKHLFEQCLRDFLKEKTVILVTHQLQFLPSVDQIIILNNGRVDAVGTYDNLRDSGLDFVKLLADTNETDTDNEGPALSRSRSGSRKGLSRRSSELSTYSMEEDSEASPMQVEEKRADGQIGWSIYSKYFQASGGCFAFVFMVFVCVLAQFLASAGDYYVNYW